VNSTLLTSSEPVIENTNVDALTVGQHGPPTAWRAFAFNNGTGSVTFQVAVICAPLG
jgi:hypothetical protein